MMNFDCTDPFDCPCDAHKSWETHVAVCPGCSELLRDSDGAVLADGAEEGRCPLCLHNWLFPRRHMTSNRKWDWHPRDLYDYHALLPLSETRELAEHAPIPDASLEDTHG